MPYKSIYTSGIFVGIIGVVFFSSKAIMVKLAYEYGVSSLHLLLFRMVFSLPFYLIIGVLYKPKHSNQIKKLDYLWLIFFGFIGYYLASYFDFLGLKYIKAGLERIILFVYPTLVLIISRIFFHKLITKKQLIAIVFTYLGVVVTFWGEIELEGDYLILGGSLIFMSALTYAAYLVGSGWLIPKFGVLVFTSYAMIVSSICVIIHYLVTDRSDLFNYDPEVYFLGLLMALIATIIPSFLVSIAIKKLGASNFSIIGSIGPISTIILAYFFLNEKLTNIQIVGTLIVIFGILIISRKRVNRNSI